jgi:hypothetical protein
MASDREVGYLEVTVASDCDPELLTFCVLQMELDSDYNFGRTCFAPGELAYFRVYGNIRYSCKATLGTPVVDSWGVGDTIEDEYVSFSSWIGSTEKPVHRILSIEWVGKSLGAVTRVQGSNSIKADTSRHDGYGVARITYTTRYDRWKLTAPSEADVVAYAIGNDPCQDTEASLTLQFRDDCDGVENNYVTLTFKNYNTGEVIVGASVWVDGILRGTTNSNGQIYLGLMTSGTHEVRATHPNYSPTQADLLGNDSFVVSG